MISEEELNQLRPLVQETPEGSPARILLEAWDEFFEEKRINDRKRAFDLVKERGHSDEEAAKLVAAWEAGESCETVHVKCTDCFLGRVELPGCMGSQNDTCPRCHGTGQTWKFKVPGTPDERRTRIKG